MRTEHITLHNVPDNPELTKKLERAIPLWLREHNDWHNVNDAKTKCDETGVSIPVPYMISMYHSFWGMDFFLFVMVTDWDINIIAKRLVSLEDIPFGLGTGFDNIPEDIFDRLEENTRPLEDILIDLKDIRGKYEDSKREGRVDTNHYNKIVKMMCDNQQRYKGQKRRIKQILTELGVKIRRGSELSKLLRLDNI